LIQKPNKQLSIDAEGRDSLLRRVGGFEKQNQHFITPESRALRFNLFVSSQPVIPTLGGICFFLSLPYRFFTALRMTRKTKSIFTATHLVNKWLYYTNKEKRFIYLCKYVII
jgi:hypothetical protein